MSLTDSSTHLFIEPSDREQIIQFDQPDSILNRLALTSGQADPFCSTTYWSFPFLETFYPERRLLFKSTDNSAVLFTELVFENGRTAITPVDITWAFGNPLLGADSPELLAELVDELEEIYPDKHQFPVIFLTGLQPFDPLKPALDKLFRSRFRFSSERSEKQCSASLAGGVDGFLSRRSAGLRRGLRKQARRAQRLGVSFERHIPKNSQQAEQIYARMLAVESVSWKGIKNCGMTKSPSREFYQRMIRRLAQSASARVIFARHDGQDIGYMFGGVAGSFYRGQQFSYDEKWAASSIGNLMQVEQVRWLAEEGIARYDLGPVMDYKTHWTEQQFEIETWAMIKAF